MAEASGSLSRLSRLADELFAYVKRHTLVELLLVPQALNSISHGGSLILNHHPPPNDAGVSSALTFIDRLHPPRGRGDAGKVFTGGRWR